LGLLNRAPAVYRTPEARAEGEFVDWLSQPTAFGLQPQELELVDARTQRWPGFIEPVDCFLFHFTYHLPNGEISGVGLAGPVCNAFRADLSAWPVADVYAAYAGWYAEHPEIGEVDAAELNEEQRTQIDAISQELSRLRYDQAKLVKVAQFFGSEHLVFSARREGVPGTIVLEEARAEWFPTRSGSRPLDPTVAYCMFKGRRLLRAFNESEASQSEPDDNE
jgi:hypothetical protein